ncbi:MAG: Zn-ribbon domain-containing OB-fold protein [Actinomycetes bacterium]
MTAPSPTGHPRTADLLTGIDAEQALHATLTLPYTLTTGQAAGAFLAELGKRRILGSRCADCSQVSAPARDHCPRCGAPPGALVQLPETGTVTAMTRTATATLALVRLDGSGTDLLHRLVGDSSAATTGARVRTSWSAEPQYSVLDLDGFVLAEDAPPQGSPTEAGDVQRVVEVPYSLHLEYRHAYGPHYGRLFDEMATQRRILGSLCPSCRNVLVPPRELCDLCFVRTAQHVDVADTGVLQAFSIIHMEFVGQTRKPPYVYAEIVLDGSATRLIHTVAGFDVTAARERLSIGMAVRAVWKDEADCRGTLEDILHFEPVEQG